MATNQTTFFVGEFTHALDSKGRVTIPSKWRISGGDNTYLALPNPSGYITVYPPKMIGRLEEGFRGQPERPQSTVAFDGIIFKGRLIRLRQAGKDKFKRQAIGACGDRGKGSISWQVDLFCDLGGRSQGSRRGTG